MAIKPFVVVGAGQAGLQICDSLRKGGYDGELILIGEEQSLPYQRPPLSKKFLDGDLDPDRLLFRPPTYYEKINVDVRLATRVDAIERDSNTLRLSDGSALGYAKLALATGTRVRPLNCPGHDLDGIYYVRTLDDGLALREKLAACSSMAVVGGGFIGLEVAAIGRSQSKSVSVVEALDRLMARAVSPMVSDFYAQLHRAHGVDLRLDCAVSEITRTDAGLHLEFANGESISADIVVAGIGVVPNEELAQACGLECRNGIVVDASATTSDENIVAAGDCTMHYNGFLEREIRLESVQNAVDQAKVAAATMDGERQTYAQVPWFWSDQYDAKLQMAGIGMPYDAYAERGDIEAGAFSIFYFRDGQLVGADSVNRPAEHMACRKLLAQGTLLGLEEVRDAGVDLMQLARDRQPAG